MRRRLWLGLTLMAAACAAGDAGCGSGDNSTPGTGPGNDGGSDAPSEAGMSSGDDAGGMDATTAGDDGGMDAGAGDAAPGDDGGQADAAADAAASDGGNADGGNADAASADGGSADGGSTDAASADASSPDAAGDAAPPPACSPDGSACSLGAQNAVCTAGSCVGCTGDPECVTAYGTGNICVSGSCVTGNCHGDSDCAQGQICGVTTAHVCGGCTTDSQCTNDPTYGASDICNTSLGKCQSNACATPNVTCAANAADECCAISSSNVCVAGNCCTNKQCSGGAPACEGNACTACDAVAGPPYTFIVDPANGSDGIGTTGSGASAGQSNAVCSFQTIHGALAYIASKFPSGAPGGTVVEIKGPATISTAGTGETFPITIPKNVTISGDGTPTKIVVSAASDGFVINATGSGLANLTIDGQSTTALHGVHVESGADATSTVSGVGISKFLGDGILVEGTGAVTITGGTQSNQNGTGAAPASGLHVTGTGKATVTGGTSGSPTAFNSNTAHGLFVEQNGAITLTGTPGVSGNGTVVAKQNGVNGLYVAQSVVLISSGNFPPQNLVTGLAVWQSGADGVRIGGGSTIKMRGNYILNNTGSGIRVEVSGSSVGYTGNNYDNVDLGNSTGNDWGLNTVQDTSSQNGAAGICFAPTGTPTLIKAMGNIFSGTKNCSTTAATLSHASTCAGSKSDVGTQGGSSIVTSMCTN